MRLSRATKNPARLDSAVERGRVGMERVTRVYPTYTRSMPSPTGWGIPYLPLPHPARRLINLRDRAEIEGPDTIDPGADTPSPKERTQPTDRQAQGPLDRSAHSYTHTHTALSETERHRHNVSSSERVFCGAFPTLSRPRFPGWPPTYIVVGRRQPPSLAGVPGQVARSTQPIPILIPTYPASMALPAGRSRQPGIPSYSCTPLAVDGSTSIAYPTPLDHRILRCSSRAREPRFTSSTAGSASATRTTAGASSTPPQSPLRTRKAPRPASQPPPPPPPPPPRPPGVRRAAHWAPPFAAYLATEKMAWGAGEGVRNTPASGFAATALATSPCSPQHAACVAPLVT
jgi:hypothetical protein